MKFGRRLHEFVRPDWKDEYINYDELKTLFKLAAPEYGGDGDYDRFLTAFDRELACADTFLEHRNLEISRRIREIQEEHGLSWDEDGKLSLSEDAEVEKREEIVSSLKEVRTLVQQTIWYCRVHEEGFMIILNKLRRLESQRGHHADKCREKYDQTQLTLMRLLLRGLLIVQSLIAQLIKKRRRNTTSLKRQQTLGDDLPRVTERYGHPASKNGRGETGLHIAAREGHLDEVVSFIKGGSDLNETVTSTKRTALHLAAIAGHDDIIQALLKAGADGKLMDVFGWTARDHAGFRGHMKIVPLLPEVDLVSGNSKPSSAAEHMRTSKKLPECLDRDDNTTVLVFLGTLDWNNPVKAVDLEPIMRVDPLVPGIEAGFALEIDILGGPSAPKYVPLPILQDTINEPLVFTVKKLEKAQIVFRVISLAWNRDDPRALVGSAIALVQNPGNSYGSKTQSLILDQKIPLLDKKDMTYMGAINLSMVTISPYKEGKYVHRKPIELPRWSGTKTDVVGHRGMGQNVASKSFVQIGENTKLAFLTAPQLGAMGIEFDVQLTKEHVPVIYHDFLISETGVDIPMNNLSLDEFLYLNKAQTWQPSNATRKRSRSVSAVIPDSEETAATNFLDRIKPTFDYKSRGHKGNIRTQYIHQPYTTLEDVLQSVPSSTSIMIEVKYPMLWECTDWTMDPYAVEMNTFVDTILDSVIAHAKPDHDITLHSFSPEICILMSLKQRKYPVLFANDAGNWPCGDQRSNDLQEAIQFAKRWGLQGLVMAAEPYVWCPRLLQYTHDAGLLSSTYGALNDKADEARKLKKHGLNAIIVDRVGFVVKTLKDAA